MFQGLASPLPFSGAELLRQKNRQERIPTRAAARQTPRMAYCTAELSTGNDSRDDPATVYRLLGLHNSVRPANPPAQSVIAPLETGLPDKPPPGGREDSRRSRATRHQTGTRRQMDWPAAEGDPPEGKLMMNSYGRISHVRMETSTPPIDKNIFFLDICLRHSIPRCRGGQRFHRTA